MRLTHPLRALAHAARCGAPLRALLLLTALWFGCERSAPSLDDTARREEALRARLTPEQLEQTQDLFAPAPECMKGLFTLDAEKPALDQIASAVDAVKKARIDKGLGLSSMSRPGVHRTAAELCTLLQSSAPLVGRDAPTSDLELAALMVTALKLRGVRVGLAVQIDRHNEEQLEHVVLRTLPPSDAPEAIPHYFDMTRAAISPEAEWAPLSEIEAIGLHHARRGALALVLSSRNVARRELAIAEALAPQLATTSYVRANYEEPGEDQEAVLAALSKVLLRRDTPDVWLLLGRTLRKQGKLDQAYDALVLVPEAHPLRDEALLELAFVACARGDRETFQETLAQARRREPLRWEGYRDAALVAIVSGDDSLAQEMVRGGQRAAPQIPVWDALNMARRLAPEAWHESLQRQRRALGACAQGEVGGQNVEQSQGDMGADFAQ